MLKNLSADEKKMLKENMYESSYKAREIIFKQGVPLSHAVFMSEGYAKIYMEGFGGKEVILIIFGPLTYMSGPGLYWGGEFCFSAMALTDVKACFVDKKLFKNIVNTNIDFCNMLLVETARRSIVRINAFMNIVHKKMPGKMAGALIFLSDVVYKNRSFNAYISRKELGEYTSMSKESAIRILKDFKDSGIIDYVGDYFKIVDYERLQKINITG
jgi:CRP/FNR family transcriptional regulator